MSFVRRYLGIAFIVIVVIVSSGDAAASQREVETTSPKITLANIASVDISYTPGNIGVGQVCTWVATASPSYLGPFDYDWFPEVGLTQAFDANDTWGGYSSSPGWYSLKVIAKDSNGIVVGSTTVTGRVEWPPYLSPDPYCTY